MHLRQTFVIVRPMASLNKAILPGGAAGNRAVRDSERIGLFLKGRPAFRMGRIAHGKRHRIIRHHKKKGGSRSQARRKTPATVGDVASG